MKIDFRELPGGKKSVYAKSTERKLSAAGFFCVEFFRKVFFPIVKKLKIRMKISRTYCIFGNVVIYCLSDRRLCPWFVTKKDVPHEKVVAFREGLVFLSGSRPHCQAVGEMPIYISITSVLPFSRSVQPFADVVRDHTCRDRDSKGDYIFHGTSPPSLRRIRQRKQYITFCRKKQEKVMEKEKLYPGENIPRYSFFAKYR